MSVFLLIGWMAGCTSQSSLQPHEMLDERTGATVAALKDPIELAPSTQSAALVSHNHASFAYLGPVEWNRSGDISYGLWIHLVPGTGAQPGDIRAPDALTLTLDDGPLVLPLSAAPRLGRSPYRPVASWGQTAYFELTIPELKRMAASRKLELTVPAQDGSSLTFSGIADSRAILSKYVQARGITGD
jgi:hypothetical protein